MFNRTFVSAPQVTQHVTETIHEHRAPTDQSVALLREMEAKALERIEKAIVVSDTHFECIVHKFQDFSSQRTNIKAIFSVNGKKMTAEFSEYHWNATSNILGIGIRDAISKKIADECLKQIADTVY